MNCPSSSRRSVSSSLTKKPLNRSASRFRRTCWRERTKSLDELTTGNEKIAPRIATLSGNARRVIY